MNDNKIHKAENITELKGLAEESLEKAKELILDHLPKEEIIAIYAKGSYVQDELQADSDVDIVVILKSEECLQEVYTLTDKYGDTTKPSFQAVAYTLSELGTGGKSERRNTSRTQSITPISMFVKHMDSLPLLYGAKPEGKLFTRTDLKDLTTLLDVFNNSFIPGFEAGTFAFSSLLKQVFWLVEREQRVLGYKPDYSWQKLADSIINKDHIIHTTLRLRRQGKVYDKEKVDFLSKLQKYLKDLETDFGKK